MKNIADFLKDRWWIAPIFAVILILSIIPSTAGLPGPDYKGCEVENSYCVDGTINGVTKEQDGSSVVTVSVSDEALGSADLDFHLDDYNATYVVGNTVFMNFSERNDRVILFIEAESRLLWTILPNLLGASPASTATVDLNTMKQVR